MVPSPKVATYDLQPEMSAVEITDKLVPEIENETADFICLNYAKCRYGWAYRCFGRPRLKAVETVDICVGRVVYSRAAAWLYRFPTADHGNADYLINEDGSPNTAHTLNLVPLFVIDSTWHGTLKSGKLADIAPSILTMMGFASSCTNDWRHSNWLIGCEAGYLLARHNIYY